MWIDLSSIQIQWLNNYYETIRKVMGPELDRQNFPEVKEWMMRNTEPFPESWSSACVSTSSLTLVTLAVALLHSIVWASSSLLHSLHPLQTCTLMLPLCSLFLSSYTTLRDTLQFFNCQIYLSNNLMAHVMVFENDPLCDCWCFSFFGL